MTKRILTILTLIGLSFSACKKEQKVQYTPSQANTSYARPDERSESLDKFTNNTEEKNRWVWQKPELVINTLGNINGKTIVDLGAGPYGYFSAFIAEKTNAKKVIALDINSQAIEFIEGAKVFLSEENRHKLETRLVQPDNPMLSPKEADIVLIVNTITYLSQPVDYLINLSKGIKDGGKLVIIDFKKRSTPIGPDVSERLAIGDLEEDLKKAGYKNIQFDECTLYYQYIVTAFK